LNPRNLDPDRLDTDTTTKHQPISKLLSSALWLFLRSQVEQVSHLEVQIASSGRQILSGSIPRLSIFADRAVYKGLHFAKVRLVGEGMQTNLSHVIRGQPLRLLEPIAVSGEVVLQETDLNASLQSDLLSNALSELLSKLALNHNIVRERIGWNKIAIAPEGLLPECLLLQGTAGNSSNTTPVTLKCVLQLANCHTLMLTRSQLQISANSTWEQLEDHTIDLGSHVNLTELTLEPGQIVCRGSITVMP
jgi:LmeA-like phospholipid-binding